MEDAPLRTSDRTALRYPARVLERPHVAPDGVAYEEDGAAALLPWSAVRWAIAAEVGEPEGVRTVVFDLLAERSDGGFEVARVDADPGDDAMQMARRVARGLGADRKVPSIKCLATDGIPARWYPDLESFEEQAIIELRQACGPDVDGR